MRDCEDCRIGPLPPLAGEDIMLRIKFYSKSKNISRKGAKNTKKIFKSWF